MLILPAIDLLGGRAVRLVQGSYDRVLRYRTSPVDLALGYRRGGATWLHLVDLEGARAGAWRQLDLIRQIAAASGLPVQAGGGARDPAQVRLALEAGASRVVVGTAALGDPAHLRTLAAEFGDRLAVSLDSRAGELLAEGWTRPTGIHLQAAAVLAVECGVTRLIHTDTARDGTLSGPGGTGIRQLLELGVPVLAAGGVASISDLIELRGLGVEGVIVGRALLEGRVDLAAALRVAG